uniref:Uncharacterized protein n=1 Tax=Nelumbo nucifera TaxID=4432 RepID=A0A822XQG6_NELNU|nr:TPA_asm: hypothetical protein HUJ06_024040 [Nelumbo nucifera]
MDEKVECKCLPSFDFIDRNQQTLGCVRKFSAESCGIQSQNIEYEMFALDRTTWEVDPYVVLWTITTEEDCKKACLEDCSYEAVVFNQECRKQKLPLRYGRRNLDESTMVYIKVGRGSERNGTKTRKNNEKTF